MATEQRLISLDDLMKFPIRINHYDKEHGNEHFVLGIESVLEYAEQLPTIEARPVVHGEWKPYYDYFTKRQVGWICTNCSGVQDDLSNGDTDYCPNCGAIMDGGADNG